MVPTKNRIGRPRAVAPLPGSLEPREEILLVAARLFTSVGFSSASTRQIAAEAGLRQASLFHYFEKKDDIYAELLDRTVQPALDFARRLLELDPPPATGLYLLVLRDVRNMSREPGKLGLLQLQLEARLPQFSVYWNKRMRLRDEYRRMIESGASSGTFDVEDFDLATSITFGLTDGIWFSYELPRTRSEVWPAVADYALRSLLREVGELEQVRKDAAHLSHQLDRTAPTDQRGRS
jgi:AcrR family transcriptional regulator